PSYRLTASIGQSDGGPTDTIVNDTTNHFAQGWTLLRWALRSCWDPTFSAASLHQLFVEDTPWSASGGSLDHPYYIFGDTLIDNCDTRLCMQEMLLCTADHLAQIGDSPGTVSWTFTGSDVNPLGSGTTTVTIPPQRTADVFIARDMALNALAHILPLDTKAY